MIDALFGLEQQVQRAIIIGLLALIAVLVVAATALGIALWIERSALESCQSENGKLRANLAVEKANTETLRKAVDSQGAAVKALGDESARRVAESKAAAARAQQDAARHAATAQGLLAQRLPAGADACVEANAMVSRWLVAR